MRSDDAGADAEARIDAPVDVMGPSVISTAPADESVDVAPEVTLSGDADLLGCRGA